MMACCALVNVIVSYLCSAAALLEWPWHIACLSPGWLDCWKLSRTICRKVADKKKLTHSSMTP